MIIYFSIPSKVCPIDKTFYTWTDILRLRHGSDWLEQAFSWGKASCRLKGGASLVSSPSPSNPIPGWGAVLGVKESPSAPSVWDWNAVQNVSALKLYCTGSTSPTLFPRIAVLICGGRMPACLQGSGGLGVGPVHLSCFNSVLYLGYRREGSERRI